MLHVIKKVFSKQDFVKHVAIPAFEVSQKWIIKAGLT